VRCEVRREPLDRAVKLTMVSVLALPSCSDAGNQKPSRW